MSRKVVIGDGVQVRNFASWLKSALRGEGEVVIVFPTLEQLKYLFEKEKKNLSRLTLVSPPLESEELSSILTARGVTVLNDNDYQSQFLNFIGSTFRTSPDHASYIYLLVAGIRKSLDTLSSEERNQVLFLLQVYFEELAFVKEEPVTEFEEASRSILKPHSLEQMASLMWEPMSKPTLHLNLNTDLHLNFYEGVTPEDLEGLLLRLSDYYRAIGGLGLHFDIHEEELGVGATHA